MILVFNKKFYVVISIRKNCLASYLLSSELLTDYKEIKCK